MSEAVGMLAQLHWQCQQGLAKASGEACEGLSVAARRARRAKLIDNACCRALERRDIANSVIRHTTDAKCLQLLGKLQAQLGEHKKGVSKNHSGEDGRAQHPPATPSKEAKEEAVLKTESPIHDPPSKLDDEVGAAMASQVGWSLTMVPENMNMEEPKEGASVPDKADAMVEEERAAARSRCRKRMWQSRRGLGVVEDEQLCQILERGPPPWEPTDEHSPWLPMPDQSSDGSWYYWNRLTGQTSRTPSKLTSSGEGVATRCSQKRCRAGVRP